MDYYKDHTNVLNEHIIAELAVLTRDNESIVRSKQKSSERKRSKTDFVFNALQGCQCHVFLLFVHTIDIKRYRNMKKRYLKSGLQPSNCFDVKTLNGTVTFIQWYSEQNAMIIPGRIPAYKNNRITILPSSQTKKYVYDHYKLVTEQKARR